MLLRSSSTPVLGSLISYIAADSPNNNNHHHETITPLRCYPSSLFHGNRLSFHPSPGSVHLSTLVSCGSSPISPSIIDQSSDFEIKGSRREEEDENDSEGEEEEVMAGVNGSSYGFNSISLEKPSLNEQVTVSDEKGLVGVEMFLSIGLEASMDDGDRRGGDWGGSGGDFNSAYSNGDGEIEEYYKRMVKENPRNPIFLGNYAHQKEYYSRAILADLKDGETLSQYAKLVWELHRDEERASSYFE
ncbi:Tetratricopeptide repeat-like superfamily protein, putative isoform 2 [Hibiscus syriacus]|uniref:Tetratricopeptide repeat-like superfamily protein, putative isoform 2 n=1 Tax=Hibiscus syriacus TaxID=106335 RepID=A0A6A2Z137_HIBSY|nr:Tetratricopeptide repeat-like superfamily protein, putative isoform 2 [Hibiscus syriacus]